MKQILLQIKLNNGSCDVPIVLRKKLPACISETFEGCIMYGIDPDQLPMRVNADSRIYDELMNIIKSDGTCNPMYLRKGISPFLTRDMMRYQISELQLLSSKSNVDRVKIFAILHKLVYHWSLLHTRSGE